MPIGQLLFVQLIVLSALGFLYAVGFLLYLHWVLWWYDIVLHILGGVWVAFAVHSVYVLIERKPDVAHVLASVIVIGILWEIFEVMIGMPRESNYRLDTSLDLLMDVIGCVIGVVFIHQKGRARDSLAAEKSW